MVAVALPVTPHGGQVSPLKIQVDRIRLIVRHGRLDSGTGASGKSSSCPGQHGIEEKTALMDRSLLLKISVIIYFFLVVIVLFRHAVQHFLPPHSQGKAFSSGIVYR